MAFFKVKMYVTDDWAQQLQMPHMIAGASTNILTEYKTK
jgi:hypothetical protein